MELFLTRFRPVFEIRVGLGLGQIERLDILGDRADQPFAHRHTGNMDRALVEAACGEQLKHPFAQQIDRADLAVEAFTDEIDRSEEHTSELQSLMRISYAVFCLKQKKKT